MTSLNGEQVESPKRNKPTKTHTIRQHCWNGLDKGSVFMWKAVVNKNTIKADECRGRNSVVLNEEVETFVK